MEKKEPISMMSMAQLPAMYLPGFRTELAIQNGVEKNILFHSWGGLGDQVCAEPAMRYAMKHFKDCDFSLATEHPELFSHLSFKRVFDLRDKDTQPVWTNYFVFNTIFPTDHLAWQFLGHMAIQAVDYVSLNMFRTMLPIEDRTIQLEGHSNIHLADTPFCLVHAGRHWPSKTFPADWWNAVLSDLKSGGVLPILIGANTDDNRGTVDVDTAGCLDLRNKTPISDLIYLCQKAKVILTNDSSPLHIAASGNAWIGFVATCKHPDYIMHWRKDEDEKVQWAWRMKNFGLSGAWDNFDFMPNKTEKIDVDKVEEEQLRSWLPDPKLFAKWGVEKAWT